jgi:hypothetical protein
MAAFPLKSLQLKIRRLHQDQIDQAFAGLDLARMLMMPEAWRDYAKREGMRSQESVEE